MFGTAEGGRSVTVVGPRRSSMRMLGSFAGTALGGSVSVSAMKPSATCLASPLATQPATF